MAKSGQYSRSVFEASDEIKDIYCEPCQKDGRLAIAEGYCKDCPEYLCAQCYRSHRGNKVLANHVLLDKDSMPITLGSKKGVLDICEQKCTVHFDKVIELFCETCDKLECTICITLDHRQCGKVKYIPDHVKDLKNSEEFSVFYDSIKTTTDKLSEFEQNIKANAISDNKMQKLAKQELKRQRAEVNKFFDELEKKIDDQILTFVNRNEDTLKKASDKLMPMKKDLDQIKNDIEEKKSGQNCELFISMKKSKEKMRYIDGQFNELQGKLTIQHYKLLPSEQIQAMMRTTTEICKISTARTIIEISRTQTAKTNTENSKSPTVSPTTEFPRTPTARFESAIDTKTSKDKTKPNIFGLTIMHGHYCVVADLGNKSIKVVDTKSKHVTSEIGIEAKYIWSVTSVSDDQVVASVTLSEMRNQIQFFSVSKSGQIQRTNQVNNADGYYLGMVYEKYNIYGVCSTHNRIDILNMRGKIVRTIKTNDKGAALFNFLNRIALSPDRQTIYVNDSGKHSVNSLTLDGKVKTVSIDKDLKEPWGITVDKYGYIYVRSLATKSIQQLNPVLDKIQVLIKDVAGNDMAYSSTENKLYIVDNDKIHVYSLD